MTFETLSDRSVWRFKYGLIGVKMNHRCGMNVMTKVKMEAGHAYKHPFNVWIIFKTGIIELSRIKELGSHA